MQRTKQTGFGGWSFWLFSAIAIGIWQSQPEISAAIEEGGIDYAIYLGPIWIKLVKDAFVVGLWLYLVLAVKDPFPASVRRAVVWTYAITSVGFLLACLWLSPLLALAGVRWIIAVFVLIELRRLYGRPIDAKLVTVGLLSLLLVHVGLQCARLFYFPPMWGEVWGLAARVPGFFLLPNTNAMFAVGCAAVLIDLLGRTHKFARLAMLLATFSAVLSQSAGGLMACIVLLAFMYFRRITYAGPLVLVVGAVVLASATSVLGRTDFLEVSGGDRIGKLAMAAGELTGLGAFGAYTNTGFMLVLAGDAGGASGREPVISDSFYVSLIGNFGLLVIPLSLLFWTVLARASRHLRKHRLRLGMASLLCLGTFGFSTVVSEAFPMTVMLSIGAWLGSMPQKVRRTRRRAAETDAPGIAQRQIDVVQPVQSTAP